MPLASSPLISDDFIKRAAMPGRDRGGENGKVIYSLSKCGKKRRFKVRNLVNKKRRISLLFLDKMKREDRARSD